MVRVLQPHADKLQLARTGGTSDGLASYNRHTGKQQPLPCKLQQTRGGATTSQWQAATGTAVLQPVPSKLQPAWAVLQPVPSKLQATQRRASTWWVTMSAMETMPAGYCNHGVLKIDDNGEPEAATPCFDGVQELLEPTLAASCIRLPWSCIRQSGWRGKMTLDWDGARRQGRRWR